MHYFPNLGTPRLLSALYLFCLPSCTTHVPWPLLVALTQPTMANASEPASAAQTLSAMSSLAIPQPASPFEYLPNEIHTAILRAISSPRDLYATIRASPTALGAFLGSREPVLLSVLERHIPPEIFCHYLVVLEVPDCADFNFVGPLYVLLQCGLTLRARAYLQTG